MAFTIAIAGKGGTGKTTLAALIIRVLTEHFGKTVLAVDADPNSTLAMMLGVEATGTVADLREDVVEKRLNIAAGASRERQMEMIIQDTLLECGPFDLLTMGRPEGPKCYCYVNHLLRNFLDKLSKSAPFVVVDNEAGMEHLSRMTTNDVELLIEVAGATVADVTAARRIDDLVGKLPVKVRRRGLVINRDDGRAPEKVEKLITESALELLGRVPASGKIEECSREGKPLTGLDFDDPALRAVVNVIKRHVLKT
jgi:CO dehydrogenase maturation factor